MPRLLDTEKFPLVSPGIARCHVPAERRQRMGAAACLCFCGATIAAVDEHIRSAHRGVGA